MIKIDLNTDKTNFYDDLCICDHFHIIYDVEILYSLYYNYIVKKHIYISSAFVRIYNDHFNFSFYTNEKYRNEIPSDYIVPHFVYDFYYNLILKTKTHLYYCKDENEMNILERKIKLQKLYDKI